MGLTRHDVMVALEKRKVRIEEVSLPGFDAVGHVREITPRDMDSFEVIMADDDRDNWRAAFAVRVLCDDKGKRLFANEDAAFIGQKASLLALDALWDAGRRVSGLDVETAERLEGNSDGAPSSDCGSD